MNVVLAKGQLLARRDADLHLDEIDAGDHFGDGMLDLDARVDFDEVEVACLVDDELDGAGVGVAGGLDQPDGRLAHGSARLGREARPRAFFDQLLMPALHGAVALPEMDDVAVLVGEDLHFDVPRPLDVLLEIDAGIAKRGFGLGRGLLQGAS